MQSHYRGTYLSTNRMVQTETGKQYGDNCRRYEHVTADQSSLVQKQLSNAWEAAGSVSSEKSRWMNDRSWLWKSCCSKPLSTAGFTPQEPIRPGDFQEKKIWPQYFPLARHGVHFPSRWCLWQRGRKKHLCCETTLHLSISPQTGDGNSWIFIRNVSRCLSVGLLTGWR